ncbi:MULTISPECIES: hypothetical protein [unclassified Rhizobacter]|nr:MULTISPECIES: hypothetical protein [unclassified Rhizobacter]KQU81169.1 hypothetical protein ASC88_15515 [Rhizobacter sp. Root29]KQW04697.1 hypothetical protein ASC98_05205 [Rhizobacter sp. Root1238]KRB06515.1 hypothetical protein ASE08_11760 [Rhizobacter sp. Root16D2]
MPQLQVRFVVEATLAAVSACALALTLAWPQWIEDVFGFEPDGGDGSSEWGLTLALAIATLAAGAAATRDWRRLRLSRQA